MTDTPPGPSRTTLDFLGREHGHLINGRWRPSVSGETFDVQDPATGGCIARVAAGGAAEIDAAVLSTLSTTGPDAIPGRIAAFQAGRGGSAETCLTTFTG